MSLYDPDLDKRFIMLDGEVVETPEDDEETGTKTCCGCFSCATGEDTEPVSLFFTVRNETNTNTRLDNIEDDFHDQHPPFPTVEGHNAGVENEDNIEGDDTDTIDTILT